MAITVSPMTTSLTPKKVAISTAPHTRIRELIINKIRPTTSHRVSALRLAGLLFSSSPNSSASASLSPRRPVQILQEISSINNPSSENASSLDKFASNNCQAAKKVRPSRIGSSLRIISERTAIGLMSAVIPRINAILAMLEPNALPSAIPELPSSAAITDTIISGAEVPKPIINMPISSGDSPN